MLVPRQLVVVHQVLAVRFVVQHLPAQRLGSYILIRKREVKQLKLARLLAYINLHSLTLCAPDD